MQEGIILAVIVIGVAALIWYKKKNKRTGTDSTPPKDNGKPDIRDKR